jgi:hypothetical protein
VSPVTADTHHARVACACDSSCVVSSQRVSFADECVVVRTAGSGAHPQPTSAGTRVHRAVSRTNDHDQWRSSDSTAVEWRGSVAVEVGERSGRIDAWKTWPRFLASFDSWDGALQKQWTERVAAAGDRLGVWQRCLSAQASISATNRARRGAIGIAVSTDNSTTAT